MTGEIHLKKSAELPRLTNKNHVVTSPKTSDYNCIGWAAGEDDRWWWPIGEPPVFYWPKGVSRGVNVESFIAAFGTIGYKVCNDATLIAGVEKVVLYVDSDGKPTHMARQLPDGKWASKLGRGNDIVHDTPAVVSGKLYGTVRVFMERPTA